MHRVIVVGSPRADGRSAHVADELFNACIEECPEDGVSIVSVASINVEACRGCDACKPVGEPPEALPEDDDTLAIMPLVAASDAVRHRCVIHDDMTEVRKHLDAADELIVVSPVYFAGPPAQFKCLLDRLQPYYWSDVRTRGKRPCALHVVGEGGDPHGFDPLVGCVQSALGCAGFQLETLYDWVGKISEDGEIVADADEYVLEAEGTDDQGEPGVFAWDDLGEGVPFEEATFEREGSCAEDGRLSVKELEEAQRGREKPSFGEADAVPQRESSAKSAASAPRAKLSLSEAKPQKGKDAQRDRRETHSGGGSQKQGSRKPKQGGKPQGGGSRQGSSAHGSGRSNGSSGSRGRQKGKASYGKNAPGKGKRRG